LPKKSNPPKIILFVILGLLVAGGLVYAGMNIGKKQTPTVVVPPVIEPTPTPDPTADWKTYTNSEYGYSIKYPTSFTTQLLSAGAGNKEADSTTRNLFIYKSDALEPYFDVERYINLEIFQIKPAKKEIADQILSTFKFLE